VNEDPGWITVEAFPSCLEKATTHTPYDYSHTLLVRLDDYRWI